MLISYLVKYSGNISAIYYIFNLLKKYPNETFVFLLIEQYFVHIIQKYSNYTKNINYEYTNVVNIYNLKFDNSRKYVLSEHPHGINSLMYNDETGICKYFHKYFTHYYI